MKKIICCPASFLANNLDTNTMYFSLYLPVPRTTQIGYIAPTLISDVQEKGINPSDEAWDFLTIALSVNAADQVILRNQSADGWTRVIDLSVVISQPDKWNVVRTDLEAMLRFLTGDFWTLHFLPGGVSAPRTSNVINHDVDCVCLLSGGLDSLVGAIDLLETNNKPMLVSQISRGDKDNQSLFAAKLLDKNHHCQWSCTISHMGKSEQSTRGRSIVFFAYALLAASSIESSVGPKKRIFVPENGFISLNIPLGPGRIGSLSTKTTHPVYMDALQKIWKAVGINAQLICPYQFRTKGEMILECKNQQLLISLFSSSVSCGKYRRHGYRHCGVCVPYLVRRAALIKAGITDTTYKGYCIDQITVSSVDVSAVASAYQQYKNYGIRSLTNGYLSFASSDERANYESVIARGMDELGSLLEGYNIV